MMVQDGSNCVSTRVLSQPNDKGVIHSAAYFSKKHLSAVYNYYIYDKELMSIIPAHEEWRPECEGATYPLHSIPDHKNIQYFLTKTHLNRKQAPRWEKVTHFYYQTVDQSGTSNGEADAVTTRQ
jgi:hypothetical protein